MDLQGPFENKQKEENESLLAKETKAFHLVLWLFFFFGVSTETRPLTERQKRKTVSRHGQLVEAGQLAEVAGHAPQAVSVRSEVLQRKAQVKPLG